MIPRFPRRTLLVGRSVTQCYLECISSHRRVGLVATCGDDLKPYKVRKTELTTQDGCVIWGNRVVIPPMAREAMLVELHAGHPGISRMKALVRSFVWWRITISKNEFNSVRVHHDEVHLSTSHWTCKIDMHTGPGACGPTPRL